MTQEQYIAESMTGCVATRNPACVKGGQLYDDKDNKLSDTEARKWFRKGDTIHVPNAGAGSYKTILRRLGFKWCKVEDWTSSAGDWCFRVWGKRIVSQSNLHPHHGFSYSLSTGDNF